MIGLDGRPAVKNLLEIAYPNGWPSAAIRCAVIVNHRPEKVLKRLLILEGLLVAFPQH